MYIYVYSSDQVSAMHPPPFQITLGEKAKKRKKCVPFQFTFGEKKEKKRGEGGGGGGGRKKKKGKEMCNLFPTCLYFEEDILNPNR